MLLPQVIFKYSKIYDRRWQEVYILRRNLNSTEQSLLHFYPTPEEITTYLDIIKPLWQHEEGKILRALSEITTLTWEAKIISCYVVGQVKAFSDPLTLPVFLNDPTLFIDMLIHELIHQLFMQPGNQKRLQPVWEYINKSYPNETQITKTHIPLHAIHSYLYHTFYTEERRQRDIQRAKKKNAVNYIRAWEIVEQKAYRTIMEDLRSFTSPVSAHT
jgi:hypothetical protein